MAKGYVSEIFSTLQGEGPHVGQPQIFIRMAGCPWRCRYCDTPASLTSEGHPSMSVEEALDQVHRLQEKKEHLAVSLTGGEPLAQAEFIAELAPALGRLGLKTHLETSGTHVTPLASVIQHIDVVAMDFKLPSAVGRTFWKEHREFLAVAGDKAFVKIVLTSDTTDMEFEEAVLLISSQTPAPLLVLQPVTPIAELEDRLKRKASDKNPIKPASLYRLMAWWDWARQKLPDVRVIPQMHPIWGLP